MRSSLCSEEADFFSQNKPPCEPVRSLSRAYENNQLCQRTSLGRDNGASIVTVPRERKWAIFVVSFVYLLWWIVSLWLVPVKEVCVWRRLDSWIFLDVFGVRYSMEVSLMGTKWKGGPTTFAHIGILITQKKWKVQQLWTVASSC